VEDPAGASAVNNRLLISNQGSKYSIYIDMLIGLEAPPFLGLDDAGSSAGAATLSGQPARHREDDHPRRYDCQLHVDAPGCQ
jgi:hypothetical protein